MWTFLEKLKTGLSKTHQGFVEKIDQLFLGKKEIDQDVLDELEGLLFEADLGVKTSSQLIEGVRQGLKRGELQEPQKVKEYIKQEILRTLKSGEKPLSIDFSRTKPFVFMVVGVNGGGKTTTIGKIAYQYSSQGKKVLVGPRIPSGRLRSSSSRSGPIEWEPISSNNPKDQIPPP
ncbi:MAG: signal recognition particle receptor subunit alpha [Thermodesulfobacteriota bacterium]